MERDARQLVAGSHRSIPILDNLISCTIHAHNETLSRWRFPSVTDAPRKVLVKRRRDSGDDTLNNEYAIQFLDDAVCE